MDQFSNRRQYRYGKLEEESILQNPYQQFKKWYQESIEAAVEDINAMSISTVAQDNTPYSRMVLLKHFSEDGLVFFTNYSSRKALQIESNPNICLNFYWREVDRQVIIKGQVKKTSEALSRKYFNSRPEASRISAIVSPQSQVVDSRQALEKLYEEFVKNNNRKDITRPEYWGGFLVLPSYYEFWQGRPDRLNDRIVYHKICNTWEINRLAP